MIEHLKRHKLRYFYGAAACILTAVLAYLGIAETERDHLIQLLNEFINEVIKSMEPDNGQ